MGQPQFDALIADKGYPKLADYLHAKFPGTIVASIGQKNYAMNSMSGPAADIRITFGGRAFDCDGDAEVDNIWRGPVGVNVPTYITEVTSHRPARRTTTSTSTPTLTSTTARSPRRRPGCTRCRATATSAAPTPTTPAATSGSTDAAFEVMDNEDWSGLLLTIGGIDKAGHMWGGLNDVPPYPAGATDPLSHMANAAKVADEQVGRIIEKLEAEACSTRPSWC